MWWAIAPSHAPALKSLTAGWRLQADLKAETSGGEERCRWWPRGLAGLAQRAQTALNTVSERCLTHAADAERQLCAWTLPENRGGVDACRGACLSSELLGRMSEVCLRWPGQGGLAWRSQISPAYVAVGTSCNLERSDVSGGRLYLLLTPWQTRDECLLWPGLGTLAINEPHQAP